MHSNKVCLSDTNGSWSEVNLFSPPATNLVDTCLAHLQYSCTTSPWPFLPLYLHYSCIDPMLLFFWLLCWKLLCQLEWILILHYMLLASRANTFRSGFGHFFKSIVVFFLWPQEIQSKMWSWTYLKQTNEHVLAKQPSLYQMGRYACGCV